MEVHVISWQHTQQFLFVYSLCLKHIENANIEKVFNFHFQTYFIYFFQTNVF